MSSKNKEVMEHSDNESDEKRTVQYLLNSPAYMSTVMRRQLLREMLKTLPTAAQGRVTALKNLQLEDLELDAKFYEEVYQLERKYQSLRQPFQDKRQQIVAGQYEPTAEETVAKVADEDDEDDVTAKMQEVSIDIRKTLKKEYDEDVKGVPDFWLTIFRCTELLSPMIQEPDEPLLKKLTDVKIVYGDESSMSYTLEFYFQENEYFTNTVLTKKYYLKSKVEGDQPYSFEGPEIYKCEGCVIHWNKNKNLTVKTVHKKQKHKARGAVRTVTKQIPADSFFNFFNPPQVNDEEEEPDMDTQNILGTDFEIGHFLRARIIPKAVLYFTGDIVDDDDDDFDEEEEEEDEEDDEDDDEDDDDAAPPPAKGGKHNKHAAGGGKANPAECQQQ